MDATVLFIYGRPSIIDVDGMKDVTQRKNGRPSDIRLEVCALFIFILI